MACVDENAAVALLEARLPADEAAELLAHAAQCDTCRELVAELAKDATVSEIDDHDLATVDPNRYAVGRVIARGGMGRITAARDRRLGRPVAIKELLIESHELRARFEREVRITAKLQHPAIVNLIEAGTWPGGEPFYVMKLITGESLDKVIAQRSTLEARLGLLPNVIAAVDALAYAHSMRVIHRDLKPANVLVGEFGETVVIDWGVAKDLADTSGEPDVAVGPFRSAPSALGQTAAGSIIGTPAYMPPEQASGGTVDERADVYALGAMLYHVLAGAPPYAGKPAEILEAVVAGSPPSLDARTPGLPPDLVTIVNKAMARATAERYPTARELNDDLKKFQTGRLVEAHHYSIGALVRRWVRRHRAAVTVASVGLVALVVVGIIAILRVVAAEHVAEDERAVAEAQRARAQHSHDDAEDLVGFMLNDMRAKLEPLGRLDILKSVATKLIGHYDRQDDLSSVADRRRRASVLYDLADVLVAQGESRQALAELRAAIAIDEALAVEVPADLKVQGELVRARSRVGDILLAQGDATGALAAFRAELTFGETLVKHDPTNPSGRHNLAALHQRIGQTLNGLGDRRGALAELRAALAIDEADPSHRDDRDLATDHDAIGETLLELGDRAGGLTEMRTALALAERLTTKDPSDADAREHVTVGHGRIGSLLLAERDVAGAVIELRAAVAGSEALVARDPTNTAWQTELAVARRKLGDALQAGRDFKAALVQQRAALAIAQTLAAKDPSNRDWERELAVGHDKLGNVLDAMHDAKAALAEYRMFEVEMAALAEKDPKNPSAQRDLAIAHGKVADALKAHGDVTGSLAAYRAYLAIAETLAEATTPSWQTDIASTHSNIGDLLVQRHDMATAVVEYRAALAIAGMLAAKDPTNVALQQDVAVRHEQLGDALLASKDAAGGVAEYRAGLAIVRRLQDKDPRNADARDLATELHTKVTKSK